MSINKKYLNTTTMKKRLIKFLNNILGIEKDLSVVLRRFEAPLQELKELQESHKARIQKNAEIIASKNSENTVLTSEVQRAEQVESNFKELLAIK